MKWYIAALKKYGVFSGRAQRKEYWIFLLFNLLIGFSLGMIEAVVGIAPESNESVLGNIYQLAIFLPSIAVSVRRMHDVNHSGWWVMVPIVSFVFCVIEGTAGENNFGSDPKAI